MLKSLKYKGGERLSRWSIFFLLILDVFVFTIIEYGVSFQKDIVTNPRVEYPYECRKLTESENPDLYSGSTYQLNYINKSELSSECREILQLSQSVINDSEITETKSKIYTTKQEITDLKTKLNSSYKHYDTSLLETIADRDKNRSIKLKKLITQYELKLKNRRELLKDYERLLELNSNVVELRNYLQKSRDKVNADYETALKYYQVEMYAVSLLFIIPVVAIFYNQMKRRLERDEYLKYTLYKHLFFTSLIPLFLTIFSIIYNYLPRVLINALIELFYKLHLTFLLYYILMGIGVFTIYFLVKYIQNRKIQRYRSSNISSIESYQKSECSECGNRVNYESMNFCPYCSNSLKSRCECGGMKIDILNFCPECGKG